MSAYSTQTQTAFEFSFNDSVVDVTESAIENSNSIATVAANDDTAESPTVYEYLTEKGILRKLTDIALKKGNVPEHLRADAAQSVHIKWSQYRVNLQYQHGQICSYAAGMGRDEVLRVRRELGAVVELPGTIFKAQNAGNATAEGLGAFVNPMAIDDYADAIEYSTTDEYMPERIRAEQVRARTRYMTLTPTQRQVVEMICTLSMTVEEVAEELGLSLSYVERLVSSATQTIYQYDEKHAG